MSVFLGNIVSAEQIMANLQFILADKSAAPSHPVGYLTSERRDVWNTLREKFASAGPFACPSCLSVLVCLFLWLTLLASVRYVFQMWKLRLGPEIYSNSPTLLLLRYGGLSTIFSALAFRNSILIFKDVICSYFYCSL